MKMENSRTLEITLQYAKDLNKVNLISKMDVYAVVSISGEGKGQKTKTPADRDGGANPTWEFPIKFTVEEAALQQNRLMLHFKLVCQRLLGNKNVGDVHVPLKELLEFPAKARAAGRRFVSYQVRKPSGKPKGYITFSYKFGEGRSAAAAEAVVESSSVYPPPVMDSVGGGGGRYYYYPPPAGVCVYPPPPTGYGYPRLPSGYGYLPLPRVQPPAVQWNLAC